MRAQEFVKDVEGIDVSLEIQKDDAYVDDDDTDNQVVFVKATSNGQELGHVLFTMSYDGQGLILNPQDLEVDERYRGQGIAKIMYDFVKSKGYRIRRSGQQTDAGEAFWQRHRPGQNVWEANTQRQQLDFDEIYGKYLKVTDNSGDPGKPGFSLVTPLNGDSWNWRERPEFKALVKQKLNDPGFLGDHKYQQIIDSMLGKQFDSTKHIATEDAVEDLEKDLKQPHSYDAIDHMMQTIAREEGITAKELHDRFVSKHGMTPDDWIKDRLSENFADDKVKGKSRPGRVKRAGASCAGSVTDLRKRAKNASGEKAKMYHWCANMKSGKKKAK
jgi:GNAT superfamily N-acetyltransferase